MFDLSVGELAMVGAVALVVLGPERLPTVARSIGQWLGKAQRFVSQVKSDINRELELAELKKLQDEARQTAQSVSSELGSVQGELANLTSAARYAGEGGEADESEFERYESLGNPWASSAFGRRYRPGLSVDELYEEVARLQRQLAQPSALPGMRRKYQPRARVNRVKIRR